MRNARNSEQDDEGESKKGGSVITRLISLLKKKDVSGKGRNYDQGLRERQAKTKVR